jgi:hypothetical protein
MKSDINAVKHLEWYYHLELQLVYILFIMLDGFNMVLFFGLVVCM